MPNTTNLSLPYPGALEVPNVPADIQELAEALDAALGDAWTPYTPNFGSSWVLGNAIVDARHRAIGKLVHYNIYVRLGNTSSVVTGSMSVSLPFPRRMPTGRDEVTGRAWLNDASTSGAAGRTGADLVTAAGQGITSALYTPNGIPISNTAPWAWATGDSISIAGTYERA